MKVLVETDILLDLLLEREPVLEAVLDLFQAIESGQMTGYVTVSCLIRVFHIMEAVQGMESAQQVLGRLMLGLQVCTVDASILQQALTFNCEDFDIAIQLACATAHNLDAVITRDIHNIAGASLKFVPVSELLNKYLIP
jgi:predicted nucleic acid-binding protein